MTVELPPVNEVVAKASTHSSFIKDNQADHRAAYLAAQAIVSEERKTVTARESSHVKKAASMLASAGYRDIASQLLLFAAGFEVLQQSKEA